jgi:hypothetical protein
MNTDYNPWSDKPRWCQPWTILLTGFSIIGGSWLLFHRIWVTGLVTVPLSVWMGFFVLLWPKLMREAIAAESQGKSMPQGD